MPDLFRREKDKGGIEACLPATPDAHATKTSLAALVLQWVGMADSYEIWFEEVKDALRSINMPIEDWQGVWPFDFSGEHDEGATPDDAAMKANRYWWHQQNKSLKQDCQRTPSCWLPRDHQGKCQPVYGRGDYVKVEFLDEATGIGEWMWVIVDHTDDKKRLVFGTLDNEPVNDYGGKVKLGSQLAVGYEQVREHRKACDPRSKN